MGYRRCVSCRREFIMCASVKPRVTYVELVNPMMNHKSACSEAQGCDADVGGQLRSLLKRLRLWERNSATACWHNLATSERNFARGLGRCGASLEERFGAESQAKDEERAHGWGAVWEFSRKDARLRAADAFQWVAQKFHGVPRSSLHPHGHLFSGNIL